MIALGRELDLLRPLGPGIAHLEAEVVWAARSEVALSLDDVLARRTRLAQELPDRGAVDRRRGSRDLLGGRARLDRAPTRRARSRPISRRRTASTTCPGPNRCRPARPPVTEPAPAVDQRRLTRRSMAEPLILALDQGTTSSRAMVVGRSGRIVASAAEELPQVFPAPGEVEHDPEAIWATQLRTARAVLADPAVDPAAIAAHRDRPTSARRRSSGSGATGRPVANAIVWQSRVTAPRCDALRAAGHEPLFRARTGLPIDAYFSGPKIAEILDRRPACAARAERGELAFGTVDTFLVWRLTGGRVHATDVSNASRTLLFDIHRLAWDAELCAIVGVPAGDAPGGPPVVGASRRDRAGAARPGDPDRRAAPATSRRRRSARRASRRARRRRPTGPGRSCS